MKPQRHCSKTVIKHGFLIVAGCAWISQGLLECWNFGNDMEGKKHEIKSKREYGSNEFIRGFFTTLHGFVLVSQSAVTRRMTVEWKLNSFFCHKYMAMFVFNDFPDVELRQIPKFKPFLPSCSRFSRSVLRYNYGYFQFALSYLFRADRHAVLFSTPPGDILPKVQHPSARASGADVCGCDVGGISGCCNQYSKMDAMVICLVVSNMAFIFHNIWDTVIHDNPSHWQN